MTSPTFPTPLQAFETVIAKWEGLWSDDPADAGNWAHCHDGTRKLIGTQHGVTPDVYAEWLNIDPPTLTPQAMQSQITLALAAEIAVKLFYLGPKFNRLSWSPLVAIAMDAGWGSGPARGIILLQQLVGAIDDGSIGPQTSMPPVTG
jgi:lysozyme family protein